MACSNATGDHKLPLMFIGKAANPRCFKYVNKQALPVAYYAQKNAWVDTNAPINVRPHPTPSRGSWGKAGDLT